MEKTELRIGNRIILYGREDMVVGIHPQTLMVATSGTAPYEDAEPILLTPEWLERLGFRERQYIIGTGSYWEHGEFNVQKEEGEYRLIWTNVIVLPPVLKHTHQLQNLYFALTGEELKTTE